jgi:hypothetical protein
MSIHNESSTTERLASTSVWPTLAFALVAMILAGAQRMLPHPFNLTMIGALGLWGGARLWPWLGLALPLVVWGVTDLIHWQLTGEAPFDLLVYSSFLVYALLGLWLRRSSSPARIGATSLLGSLQFFLVTNFGAWLTLSGSPYELYTPDLQGLLDCYAMGIPFWQSNAPPLGFLGNLILGDLAFCGLLFGAHALLLRALLRGRKDALALAPHQ